LLQRWFSATTHRSATDPYFLYAASNLGSLLALAAYPVLIEPRVGLIEQSRWWRTGYVVLVMLMVLCGLCVRRAVVPGNSNQVASEPEPAPLTRRRRARWLMLAFVPSSLMLSVTTYMTSEIAPVPLLWVIPLGIYLLTFVLVFARRRLIPHKWMVWALPFTVMAVLWTVLGILLGETMEPIDDLIALHLANLFVVAMVCHGELANDRPPRQQLTEFYLWISTGGVLGGIFNALLAPILFPTVYEYPVTLVLACGLMPRFIARSHERLVASAPRHERRAPVVAGQRERIGDFVWPVLLGLLTAGLIAVLKHFQATAPWLVSVLTFGVPVVVCLCFCRRPLRFALGVTAMLAAIVPSAWALYHPVLLARSFYGIHRVTIAGDYHTLHHGCTVHGLQSFDPARRREPLAYYSRPGPLGRLMAVVPMKLKQQVAVVGLGAGAAACYGQEGQQWTFYEIDPTVERIARDPRYFTFLGDCRADVTVVLGDARLSLERAADGRFGVIILDAYNSDSLPLHLITREALALYLRKLAPDGVLAFHISTRHLDLQSVLANLARDAGLFALHMNDGSSLAEAERGHYPSHWLIMTRRPQFLLSLERSGFWQPPGSRPGVGVWTDDYASLFRVWRWY
jgi:hypothetical protein